LSLGSFSLPPGYNASNLPANALGSGESVSFNVTLLATNPGLFNAPLVFMGNDAFNASLAAGQLNAHTINLSGTVTDTADHWRQQSFGADVANPAVASDNANPSGDGIPNLVKYSLGLNPLISYQGTPGITVDFTSSGELRMTVSRNPLVTDVTVLIETSSDLKTWSSLSTVVDQNTASTFQAHDTLDKYSSPSRFIRMRVIHP
jgi:hypothetical protein